MLSQFQKKWMSLRAPERKRKNTQRIILHFNAEEIPMTEYSDWELSDETKEGFTDNRPRRCK